MRGECPSPGEKSLGHILLWKSFVFVEKTKNPGNIDGLFPGMAIDRGSFL